MALYPKLRKRPALFLATTGMALDRFQALLPEFERVYGEREALRKADETYDGAMNVVAGLVNLRVYDRIGARMGLDLLAVTS